MIFAKVNPYAESVGIEWLTNSMVFAIGVVAAVVLAVQIGLRQPKLIPVGFQNFFEWIYESLRDILEGIVGKHMINKTYPLLLTLFLFILIANWSALLPGVGTIGWGHEVDGKFHITSPLLRPANADLNMTFAMALFFMVVWAYWTVREVGVMGFIRHTFEPKGVKGALYWLLFPIFIGVGIIEVVSIAFRALSLPLRLYGNIFAGKNLVHEMAGFGGFLVSAAVSIPFYFLELLIGLIQALVFVLLCSVYIGLSTQHEEDH
jgi:F-type H+-transporting ATPase subunit a